MNNDIRANPHGNCLGPVGPTLDSRGSQQPGPFESLRSIDDNAGSNVDDDQDLFHQIEPASLAELPKVVVIGSMAENVIRKVRHSPDPLSVLW